MGDGRGRRIPEDVAELGRQFFYHMRAQVPDLYVIPFSSEGGLFGGKLDLALSESVKPDGISDDITSRLHFPILAVGLRCAELPGMFVAAQDALILEAGLNASGYTFPISEWSARDALREFRREPGLYDQDSMELLTTRVITYLRVVDSLASR